MTERNGVTMNARSDLEQAFLTRLIQFSQEIPRIANPQEQYRFSPTRKWAIDFAWPDEKVAVELEGGVHSGGRHVRGDGYTKDCEKYNALALDGWCLLRYTAYHISHNPAAVFYEINLALERAQLQQQARNDMLTEISRLRGVLAPFTAAYGLAIGNWSSMDDLRIGIIRPGYDEYLFVEDEDDRPSKYLKGIHFRLAYEVRTPNGG